MTTEEFKTIQQDNKPNKFIVLIYALQKKQIKIPYMCLLFIAFMYMGLKLALQGNIGYYNEWPTLFTIFFFIFTSIFPITFLTFLAIKFNNLRIRNLCRKYSLSIEEYNELNKQYKNDTIKFTK